MVSAPLITAFSISEPPAPPITATLDTFLFESTQRTLSQPKAFFTKRANSLKSFIFEVPILPIGSSDLSSSSSASKRASFTPF